MTSRHVAGLVLAGACALCIFFLAPPQVAQAYDCTTVDSGAWSDKSIWDSCNGWYPGSGDTATINDGHSVHLTEEIQVSGLTVAVGGALDLNYCTLTVADGAVAVSGALSGAGTLYTTGASSLFGGSGFAVAWEVASGTTTASGGTNGPVTVAAGATLDVTGEYLEVDGDMTVNGKVTGAKGAILTFRGASFTNNGEVLADEVDFSGAGTQTIGGGGPWAGDAFSHSALTLVLTHDLSLAYNSYDLYNTLSLGAYTLTASGGVIDSRGAVTATTGRFRTTGAVDLHGTASGTFSAALEISSGATIASGDFWGPVTVASGATLQVSDSSDLLLYDNVTVNGTLSSAGSLTTLKLLGSTFTNAGQVSAANISFLGDTQTIGGAGSWTGTGTLSFSHNSPVTLANDVSMAFGAFVNAAIPLNLQGHTLSFTTAGSLTFTNYGELNLGSQPFVFSAPGGATFDGRGPVNGTGEFRTSGTVSLTPATFGAFNPTLHVLSGTTTAQGTLNGAVVVDTGATLQVAANYNLDLYGNLTVNGTLTGGETSTLYYDGASFTNNGTVSAVHVGFYGSGAQTLAGAGTWTGAVGSSTLVIGGDATVTLANNVLLVYGQYTNYGTLALGTYRLTVGGGGVYNNGAVTGYGGGVFRAQGNSDLYSMTDDFTAALEIYSGTTISSGRVDGPVTVASGATLQVEGGSNLELHGNVTVAGTLSGGLYDELWLYGGQISNSGTISANSVYFNGSGQTISGAGSWTGTGSFNVWPSGNVTLPNSLTMHFGAYDNRGVLALNGLTLAPAGDLVFNNSGTLSTGSLPFSFTVPGVATFNGAGGTVNGTGEFRTYGTVSLTAGTFYAPLYVGTSVTTASGAFRSSVTVAGGATLQVPAAGSLSISANLTNDGTVSGGAGSTLDFSCGGSSAQLITNSGSISVPAVTLYCNGDQTLQGAGGFDGNTVTITGTGFRFLGSNHRLSNLVVAGEADSTRFYLNGHTLTLTGAGTPLTVNHPGGLRTAGSTISYFGTTEGQQVATTNVDYDNLTISNAAGVTGASNLTVAGLLYMAEGVFSSGCAAHDVLISATGVLSLSGDCTVGGDFTNYNAFGLIGNGHTVAFNGSGDQHLAAHAATVFDSLTVDLGVTLIETEAANYAAANSLTNRGVIRKTQAIAGAGALAFGLTGVQMNVTTRGTLASLTVDRADTNHPNATVSVQTGRYWTLTPSGSGYTVDLLLPHNNLTDPTACRYTGSNWDCSRTSFEPTTVRRDGITALSAWAVGFDILPAEAPEVDISKSGSNVMLGWVPLAADAGGYVAWYSGSPYFTPGPPATSVALPAYSTGWTHTGGAGNPLYNWFYVVQGVNGAGVASGPSNRTGTFSFSLAPGTQ